MEAIALLTGATAGIAHVLSGPDHLAALAPMAATRRRAAWMSGLFWSMGHAGGVIGIGVLSIWLREALPLDMISSWGERLVGIVLIGIGIWGLKKALTKRLHAHEHTHGGWTHSHVHWHDAHSSHTLGQPAAHRHGVNHSHAAMGLGCLHGLAGGSHFLSVLPALAFPSALQALGYLGAYGAGTVVAMVGFSSLIGELARRFSFNHAQAHSVFLALCSLLAVGVGGYWLLA